MSFTCPRCGAISHHPIDERERYCSRCHVFVDDPPFSPAIQQALIKFWRWLDERHAAEKRQR